MSISSDFLLLSVIVHLFPVSLVSRGVNIVAERLDGSRRRLAQILQDCKFSLEIYSCTGRSGFSLMSLMDDQYSSYISSRLQIYELRTPIHIYHYRHA